MAGNDRTQSERDRQRAVMRGEDTVVANQRKHRGARVDDRLIEWAEQNDRLVHIDRRGGWGNRYKMRNESERDQSCDRHREYLMNNLELLERIGELKGKMLVCRCHPKCCHGDTLAELANRES